LEGILVSVDGCEKNLSTLRNMLLAFGHSIGTASQPIYW